MATTTQQPHTTTATGTATSWLPKTGEGVSTMQETTGTAGQLTEEELLNNYLPTKLLKNELQVALHDIIHAHKENLMLTRCCMQKGHNDVAYQNSLLDAAMSCFVTSNHVLRGSQYAGSYSHIAGDALKKVNTWLDKSEFKNDNTMQAVRVLNQKAISACDTIGNICSQGVVGMFESAKESIAEKVGLGSREERKAGEYGTTTATATGAGATIIPEGQQYGGGTGVGERIKETLTGQGQGQGQQQQLGQTQGNSGKGIGQKIKESLGISSNNKTHAGSGHAHKHHPGCTHESHSQEGPHSDH